MLPPVTQDDRREGLRRICGMFNAAGITSAHDAIVSPDDLRTYQEGRADGDLTLRVYSLMWHTHLESFSGSGIRTGFGDEWLRVGGIKMISDGAISGRTAWLSETYEGSEDDFGIRVMTPEELEPIVLEAHRAGFQVCIHANGDAAIDMVLTAYEKAMADSPRENARHRIEHCTLINDSILRRMKALGCVATPLCTYVLYHGEKTQF